jgi:peroxiredoxin
LRDHDARIRELGASVIAVICQNAETVRAHFARNPVPFPIAIDQERRVARAYGVYRLLGFDSIHIARPATFIVGPDGRIRRHYAGQVQWQMLPIGEILASLRARGSIPAASPGGSGTR